MLCRNREVTASGEQGEEDEVQDGEQATAIFICKLLALFVFSKDLQVIL